MQSEQLKWTPRNTWDAAAQLTDAGLVLVFGASDYLHDERLGELRERYPHALLFGCSTAGEIQGVIVEDDTITATAIKFSNTAVKLVSLDIAQNGDSQEAGKELARQLPHQNLSHVLVLSDGLNVNGTDLVAGVMAELPDNVEVTGGLAGDGGRFQRTLVIANDTPTERKIALLGLYGNNLQIGCGSLGGWTPFGPDRLITRSRGNVLYELDDRSALELYKKYLGEHS